MFTARILAVITLGLTASSAAAAQTNGSPLIGAWAPLDSLCESDNVVTYRTDGTFEAYDISGRWVLRGNKLTTLVTERGAPDEQSLAVKPAEKHDSIIVSLKAGSLTERWSDGSLHHRSEQIIVAKLRIV